MFMTLTPRGCFVRSDTNIDGFTDHRGIALFLQRVKIDGFMGDTLETFKRGKLNERSCWFPMDSWLADSATFGRMAHVKIVGLGRLGVLGEWGILCRVRQTLL